MKNKIETFLKKYKVSAADGAKILGVSPGNLSSWRNEKQPIPEYIDRILNIHNTVFSKPTREEMKRRILK